MINNKFKNKGFSLVETITAVIIGATMASVLLAFLTSSLKSFNASEEALNLQNESQQSMNIIVDNIMICSEIVSIIDKAGNPVVLTDVLAVDTEYNLSSFALRKYKNNDSYIETYQFINNKIQYTSQKKSFPVAEVTGVVAEHVADNGFKLFVNKGKSINQIKYITLQLDYEDGKNEVTLKNTARFRNSD